MLAVQKNIINFKYIHLNFERKIKYLYHPFKCLGRIWCTLNDFKTLAKQIQDKIYISKQLKLPLFCCNLNV